LWSDTASMSSWRRSARRVRPSSSSKDGPTPHRRPWTAIGSRAEKRLSGRDETVDKRQERVGRNEALFRTVNEKLKGLNGAFSEVARDGDFAVVCECGDATCVEQLRIPSAEYGRIRGDRTLFVIAPGHEDVTAEAVVEEDGAAYVVVRKHPGGPADLAAEHPPDS
jgi:hypothetical protein